MMYKVIEFFHDLTDNNHAYEVGDVFPREGVEVTEERLAELAGTHNKRGIPLIAKAPKKKAQAKKKASE